MASVGDPGKEREGRRGGRWSCRCRWGEPIWGPPLESISGSRPEDQPSLPCDGPASGSASSCTVERTVLRLEVQSGGPETEQALPCPLLPSLLGWRLWGPATLFISVQGGGSSPPPGHTPHAHTQEGRSSCFFRAQQEEERRTKTPLSGGPQEVFGSGQKVPGLKRILGKRRWPHQAADCGSRRFSWPGKPPP